MQIESQQTLAVVDDDTIPFEEERTSQDYSSAVHGVDLRSGGDAEIQSLMRALYGAVEDALNSEDVRNFSFNWRREGALPFAIGAQGFEGFLFDLLGFFDFLLIFGAGGGIATGNLQ